RIALRPEPINAGAGSTDPGHIGADFRFSRRRVAAAVGHDQLATCRFDSRLVRQEDGAVVGPTVGGRDNQRNRGQCVVHDFQPAPSSNTWRGFNVWPALLLTVSTTTVAAS